MYDLRTAMLNGLASFSLSNVDEVAAFESTELALENIKAVVFSDTALVIGDWITESSPATFSFNRVKNTVEIIIAYKGNAPETDIPARQQALAYACNGYLWGNVQTLSTIVSSFGQIEQREATGNVYYCIATLEVVAHESIAGYEPYTSYTAPSFLEFTVSQTSVASGVRNMLARYKITKGTEEVTQVLLTICPHGEHSPSHVENLTASVYESVDYVFHLAEDDYPLGVYDCTLYALASDGMFSTETYELTLS